MLPRARLLLLRLLQQHAVLLRHLLARIAFADFEPETSPGPDWSGTCSFLHPRESRPALSPSPVRFGWERGWGEGPPFAFRPGVLRPWTLDFGPWTSSCPVPPFVSRPPLPPPPARWGGEGAGVRARLSCSVPP